MRPATRRAPVDVRVLLVSHLYPPDGVAGVERYTQSLAAELTAAGDQVTVVTRRIEPGSAMTMTRETEATGVQVRRIVGGRPDVRRFLDLAPEIERRFLEALVEADPDVVHVNHLVTLSPRLVSLAHRLTIPVVMSLHDFYLSCALVHLRRFDGALCDGPAGGLRCAETCFASDGSQAVVRWGLRTAYFRRIAGAAERVICHSHYLADSFARFGVDRDRLRIIPNGVPDAFGAAGYGRSERQTDQVEAPVLRIAYCGVVVAHKGVHVILDALRLARIGRVDLTIVGDTPDAGYRDALVRGAGAIEGLRLAMDGAYERDDLPGLLADADCVIVPSQVPEAGPIVPREALACGVPILTSDLGALPELVDMGVNGFTFAAGRASELATILQDLAADPELRLRLRQGARLTPVVTVQDHAQAVRAVYEEAIESFAGPRSSKPGDDEELAFLEAALTHVGFAGRPAD